MPHLILNDLKTKLKFFLLVVKTKDFLTLSKKLTACVSFFVQSSNLLFFLYYFTFKTLSISLRHLGSTLGQKNSEWTKKKKKKKVAGSAAKTH
jgi:hypothetical protein